MESPPRFLAIVGPTTSGKTALSVAVAQALDGEIISMDSRQVYRGMDIGTDKVDLVDRARAPHHGLDLRNPDQRYSAGQFARDARRRIDEIRSRGRVPVLAGGTGFFLRALTEPIFGEPALDSVRLERLRSWLGNQPRERLERWVRMVDPVRAPTAIPGGPHRMSRTLEVALLSGRPLSWWHRNAPPEAPGERGLVVMLDVPREVLNERIDARVRTMVERGLTDEVRRLLAAGYRRTDPGMTGTGYREIAAHLSGEMTLDAALESMALQTRQYARRQLTWFRHQLPPSAVWLDGRVSAEALLDQIVHLWRAANGNEVPMRRTGARAENGLK